MADDDSSCTLKSDTDVFFVVIASILVFFMQLGFSMLEVGSVQSKSTKNVLIKNTSDTSIGAIAWALIGHGLAFGKDAGGVVGTTGFVLRRPGGDDFDGFEYALFLFQWSFVSTSATIVSGAVAERIKFHAYLIFAFFLCSFPYPLVAHWLWHEKGWLSAYRTNDAFLGCGTVDFAGSCVVHIVGGLSALIAVYFLGPRDGVTFVGGKKRAPEGQSVIFQTLGTLILWTGWFGFNGGSSLGIAGNSTAVARACVMTAVAGAMGSISTAGLCYYFEGQIINRHVHNGILAGLVSITANCATVNFDGACIIGFFAAPCYLFSSRLLERLEIDDVVNASPVHLACGTWGIIATGFFTKSNYYGDIYHEDRAETCAGLFYGGSGQLLLGAIATVVVVVVFVTVLSAIVLGVLWYYEALRIPKLNEIVGIDTYIHNDGDIDADNDAMDRTLGHERPEADEGFHGVEAGSHHNAPPIASVEMRPLQLPLGTQLPLVHSAARDGVPSSMSSNVGDVLGPGQASTATGTGEEATTSPPRSSQGSSGGRSTVEMAAV